jgi:hypothetical protein
VLGPGGGTSTTTPRQLVATVITQAAIANPTHLPIEFGFLDSSVIGGGAAPPLHCR